MFTQEIPLPKDSSRLAQLLQAADPTKHHAGFASTASVDFPEANSFSKVSSPHPTAQDLRHIPIMPDSIAVPTEIILHQTSRILEIAFPDGSRFRLPCEFLRVFSPSAEVRGHGAGQEVLQVGKRDVTIQSIDPVGAYAVKLVFSDGHDTGLFSWEYLQQLGKTQETLWRGYLDRLAQAGASRDPFAQVNLQKLAAVPADRKQHSERAPTDE